MAERCKESFMRVEREETEAKGKIEMNEQLS
jgi:hypothetical protein